MRQSLKLLRKFAVFCHRWMGVTFCLLFLWWFVSGIFMMYWRMPNVEDADRLFRAQPLDISRIRISPEKAAEIVGAHSAPTHLTLSMFDGRPVYVFDFGAGKSMVNAGDGSDVEAFTPELNLRTAAAWTGQPPSAATVETLQEPDQWTVNNFGNIAPVTKYSWPNGEQVYVSEGTGEVVQYTTTASRIGGYLGPVAHWLYFTPLRRNGELWSRIVIWTSGIGTIMSILGLIVGLSFYSPTQRYRHQGAPSTVPYTGQRRLHMILGLFFGLLTCTWAFSGMLSMEPFPSWSGRAPRRGGARTNIVQALRGEDAGVAAFAKLPLSDALSRMERSFAIKEVELATLVGEPVYIVRNGSAARVVPVHGPIQSDVLQARVVTAVRDAVSPARLDHVQLLTEYDAYYLDRNKQKPLPVLRFELADEGRSRYYVDPATAELVGTYNSRGWVTRWLYHALHSIDLPWLYRYRPAWDIVVLVLMLGGTALCVTSVIIAWQYLGGKFSRRA
ncbi:MAG: PepSY domain-containing protein [Bryobacteraceae bacterium]